MASGVSRNGLRTTTDARRRAATYRRRDMERRYSCGTCGIKWFVASGDKRPVPPCAACGGVLVPLADDQTPEHDEASAA